MDFYLHLQKMTPYNTGNPLWHEEIQQIGKKAKNVFFGSRAPIWGCSLNLMGLQAKTWILKILKMAAGKNYTP